MTCAHFTWKTDVPLTEDTSQAQTQISCSICSPVSTKIVQITLPSGEKYQFFPCILAFNLSTTV